MIKYNNSTINDWNFDDSNIVKVYRNGAVVYYKVTTSGGTPQYDVCYAVVDDITQYQEREFVDVFDNATEKWYKLNNLNQYEEYGIYGDSIASGETSATYYQGKLAIVDGYEYMYSGSSWVNVGEVSGSTATLPNVPFSVNYNAKNYNASTQTLIKTSGQLVDVDAVITGGTPTVNDGYLTIANYAYIRAKISGYQNYFNRDNSNPNLTIISKQRTDGINGHMFANRDSSYNWMYRCYSNKLTLHGSSETGSLAVTTQPVIESVRVDSNRTIKYNNYTNNTTSSASSFSYGSTNSGSFAMFQGYANTTGEYFVGDFYWVYMSQNTLTDEQIQQVIAYNEGGGGQIEYPIYYDEKSDPLDNLSFSSMTEANTYAYNNCVYNGMKATIDGVRYIFSGDSQSGYEWVEQTSRLPQGYTEVEYVENTTQAYINTNLQIYSSTTNSYEVEVKVIAAKHDGSTYQNVFSCMSEDGEPYQGFTYRYIGNTLTGETIPTGQNTFTVVNNEDSTQNVTVSSSNSQRTYTHTYPLTLFCGLNSSRNPFRWTNSKIYFCKVTMNGVLIIDLVPCKRDSDNMVGMYDLVNDVFYYPPNYSSYQLVAGPSV